MLGLLNKKNNQEQIARERMKPVYANALIHARKPLFYKDYKVPDTLDARFEILALHIILIMQRILNETPSDKTQPAPQILNQALFDIFFQDLDITLREMGIGDMGIPKRMRRYMTAFNSRIHTLTHAIENNDKNAIENIIAANIYNPTPPPKEAQNLIAYIMQTHKILISTSLNKILTGNPFIESITS